MGPCQETPCPKRHKHDRSEVVAHLTVELLLQGHVTKHCFHHSQKSVTIHLRFFVEERTNNFVFIKVHHTLTFSNHIHVQSYHEDSHFLIHSVCAC